MSISEAHITDLILEFEQYHVEEGDEEENDDPEQKKENEEKREKQKSKNRGKMCYTFKPQIPKKQF